MGWNVLFRTVLQVHDRLRLERRGSGRDRPDDVAAWDRRGRDWESGSRRGAIAAEEVALAAGPADATGVHGGGGHAVMDAAVGGAGSPLGCAEAAATSEAVPGGFSGAITRGFALATEGDDRAERHECE